MAKKALLELSAAEAVAQRASGAVSAAELAEAALSAETSALPTGFVPACPEPAQARGGSDEIEGLRCLPLVVESSLCASLWRRWGVAAGIAAPIAAHELDDHPVVRQLISHGGVAIGAANGAGCAVAAVAHRHGWGGFVVDDARGNSLSAAAASGLVALHPSPATIPHRLHPDGHHIASLHGHATLIAREVADAAVLFDELYDMRGWGSLYPQPRSALGDSKGPPSAREAVAQARAGFNRTLAPPSASRRRTALLPERVAWTVDLLPGESGLGTECETAARRFERLGATVAEACPAGLGAASSLLERCHAVECARASGEALCVCMAQRRALYPVAMAILVLASALLLAPLSPTVAGAGAEVVTQGLSVGRQLLAIGHGLVFKGWALTILLLCLGLSLLLIHHALDLVPPVWRAGIQASRRWAGPLAPAHERERRLQHRRLLDDVDALFSQYDLLCTVIPLDETEAPADVAAKGDAEDEGQRAAFRPTVASIARLMCCPALSLPLPASKKGKGARLALLLVGKPYGDDALLAAAAAYVDLLDAPKAPRGGASEFEAAGHREEAAWRDGLGSGAKAVGSVVCSERWAGCWRRVEGWLAACGALVAGAYNRQRLSVMQRNR